MINGAKVLRWLDERQVSGHAANSVNGRYVDD